MADEWLQHTAIRAAAKASALAARERLAATATGMLDDNGRPRDSRWWFASSYVRTTDGAVEEAEAGSFADAVFIYRLIAYFEKLYQDNLAAADAGRPVEPHWQRAFDVAARADTRRRVYARVRNEAANQSHLRGVVESVVAASRAHVRFDLPRAMSWVHQTRLDGLGSGEFSSYIGDFMAMAAVFERATLAANVDVARQTRLPIQLLPRQVQEWGMRFFFRADLIHERAFAWECAQELVTVGGVGTNPYTEPVAGRLEGDVTATPAVDVFAAIDAALRPTMDALRRAPVDTAARAGAGLPDALDTVERIRALQGLCHGYTGPGDERAIVALLAASARIGDLEAVVNGVGAWELAANLHGREKRALRTLLRAYYYPVVQSSIAAALLRRAVRFAQLPWEDAMIGDLLCDRRDGEALLATLDDDDASGWQRVQRVVDRTVRSRILAANPGLRS
ncbi:DUF5995 family protein [Mycolicibacterium sp.]|uniref:DUF5995 family protein n=1 Tax=Mycolicibacterium sp. TaxID=2320850 RepID=UPI003D0B21CF